MNTIELKHVKKYYGAVRAVDDLDLGVPRGSVYGFIGPNGSGKTTTLRMIMNIIRADSGTVLIFGDELRSATTDRIGYMPEERGIYSRMKVGELLEFYGSLKNGRDLKRETAKWLEIFSLSDRRNAKIETLSKGMKQKVQFIATVITRPELVILDEPFSGLDPVNRDIIKDAVLDLKKRGSTVILSTHDMNMAERMCDHIFMIFRGKKVLDGTVEGIRSSYGTDTVRMRCDGGAENFTDIPGIESINDYGRELELRIEKDTDTQKLLAAVLRKTRVEAFEVVSPSLHDIFKRIAGPEAEEAEHGQA